jgi:hypothetical protein
MSRTWKHFGLTALVLLVMSVVGQGRDEDQNTDKGFQGLKSDPTEQLKQINQKLDGIREQLKDLPELRQRIKTLEGALPDTLKIPAMEAELQRLGKAVNDLGSQLEALQKSSQRLDEKMRNQDARVARALEPRPGPSPTAGTIKLQNRSGVSATVVIDNRGYVLAPFETRLLENRPLGSFTYEVLADAFGVIQAPVARTLNPEEVFVIQINR